MITYHINELFIGLKVIYNGDPCIIIANECVKPGKGQSFNRVRFRQIISGKILEKTFKSGDYLESADIVEINVIYLYYDREFWYFMDQRSFEQIMLSRAVIGSCGQWMVQQLYYMVTLWKNIPILVTPPNFVVLQVIDTIPVMKGNSNTISSGMKLATVSTKVIIKVPFFIQLGEYIKIDTRTGIYVSRVKNGLL